MGLTFLTPLFLYGALGALVPLLLHLIKRQRSRVQIFSTLRFLKISQKAIVRQQRLRRWLLLLLRMVACAILAMIFARPFLKDVQNSAFAGPTPKAMAILIDNSYSMGFGNRMDLAKRRAIELLGELHPGDQVVLMSFSSQTQMIREIGTDHENLAGLIETGIVPSYQGTNYLEALRSADDQLNRSRFEDRTIYIVSDFQQAGWDRQATRWQLSSGIGLKVIDVWDERDANIAITATALPRPISESDRTQDIVVRVKNYGMTPFQGEMTLDINGGRAAAKQVSIPSQSGQVVTFRETFRADANTGLITMGSDDLPIDNQFYFTVNLPSPLRVLIVEERSTRQSQSSAAYYLSQALSLRQDPPLQVDVRPVWDLSSIGLGKYQTVIMSDIGTLPRAAKTRLTEYVRSGGGVLIGQNRSVSSNIFNTSFGELLPGRVESIQPDKIRRDQFSVFADINYQHPIFQPFSGPHHGDFGAARFFKFAKVKADSTAAILGKFDDGNIALLEKTLGRGRSLMLTSTLDLTWNDFSIRGVFVPFLYQSVDYLAAQVSYDDRRSQYYHLIGETVRLPDDVKTVTSPSKAPFTLERSETEMALFTETIEPGLYSHDSTVRTGHFAINLDTRESDFTRLEIEEFVAAVINPVTESQEAQEMKSQANQLQSAEVERRQRLWWYLSMFLLTVVLGETFLASRTHR